MPACSPSSGGPGSSTLLGLTIIFSGGKPARSKRARRRRRGRRNGRRGSAKCRRGGGRRSCGRRRASRRASRGSRRARRPNRATRRCRSRTGGCRASKGRPGRRCGNCAASERSRRPRPAPRRGSPERAAGRNCARAGCPGGCRGSPPGPAARRRRSVRSRAPRAASPASRRWRRCRRCARSPRSRPGAGPRFRRRPRRPRRRGPGIDYERRGCARAGLRSTDSGVVEQGTCRRRLSRFGTITLARTSQSASPHDQLTQLQEGRRLTRLRTASSAWRAFGLGTALVEILIIGATSVACGIGYHLIVHDSYGELVNFIALGGVVALIFLSANAFIGDYALPLYIAPTSRIRRPLASWNIAFLYTLAISVMAKSGAELSRGSVILLYFAGIGVIMLWRWLLIRLVVRASKTGQVAARRVLLVGERAAIEAFARRYQPWNLGFEIVGQAVLQSNGNLEPDLDRAALIGRALHPDDVFVILPWSDTERSSASSTGL